MNIEDVKKFLEGMKEELNKSISHLENELKKIRAGKASPGMVDGIQVDYYGNSTPLSQVANVNTPDAKTIVIQPWEKSMLEPIEKAIMQANIGFTPMNDGTVIRINVPPLTEERRKELVKMTKSEAEDTKVSVRNARRDANERVRAATKKGLSEDLAKDAEDDIQKLTNSYIKKIDEHVDLKEKEIMTI
ncbi:MAG: ribosome recycling factor [Bacteroidia bacterium]|nr:ribosome recycling factor [Bacteroidia bacterium]